MTNFAVSISNSINSFGPAPSTKWGTGSPYTMTWGTSKWGEGTQDLIVEVVKLITNAVSSDTALFNHPNKLIDNSVIPTSETSMETLQTANGYYYTFTYPTSDAEDRNQSTYTEAGGSVPSYMSQAAGGTSWSSA